MYETLTYIGLAIIGIGGAILLAWEMNEKW